MKLFQRTHKHEGTVEMPHSVEVSDFPRVCGVGAASEAGIRPLDPICGVAGQARLSIQQGHLSWKQGHETSRELK